MGAKENYEARKAADKAKREAKKQRHWWFSESVPIDRFTGWLVTWTALLFIATVINAGVLWKTDNTLHDIFGKQRYTRFCVYYDTLNENSYCTEHNDGS